MRRSFDGSVSPLYQSAYLMGALQFRALHTELVQTKKMTDQEFHDAILRDNKYPAKAHAKRVSDYILEHKLGPVGTLYLESRMTKLLEDSDQAEHFRY